MKTQWALMNPENGRFWDGNVPMLPSGVEGRVSYMFTRWRPGFRSQPKVFASESTVDRRWHAYEAMREVKPDIPTLARVEVEVTHKVLRTPPATIEISLKERQANRLRLLYGQHLGDDWLKYDSPPDARFWVQARLPQSNFPDRDPDAYSHFLTLEERVLLRFIDAKVPVTDVSVALGNDLLPREETDPYPKDREAEEA